MKIKPIFNQTGKVYKDNNNKVICYDNTYTVNENTMHYYKFDINTGFYYDSTGGEKDLSDTTNYGLNNIIHYTGDTPKFIYQSACANASVTLNNLIAPTFGWFNPYQDIPLTGFSTITPFTISFWIYRPSSSSSFQYYKIIKLKSQYNWHRQNGSNLTEAGFKSEFAIQFGTNDDWLFLNSGTLNRNTNDPDPISLQYDKWQHIVCIAPINYTTNFYRLYVDGVLSVDDYWYAQYNMEYATDYIEVFQNRSERTTNPTFYMDEIIIENRIWTENEIISYYNNYK